MKPKLIIDTNKARNDKGFRQLLGNRTELEKFANQCKLILPSMVIEEIIHQKKKSFEVYKQSFTGSHLYKNLPEELKRNIEENLLFDENILRADQSIEYAVIDVTDSEQAFNSIRYLAINHEAPFEVYSVELGKQKKDNTDKGFKDAYIALTIRQYVESISSDEIIFVLVRDRRLEEYLDKIDRVICISNYEEFESRYQMPSKQSNDSAVYAHVVPESKERQRIRALLTELRNAPNFKTTHKLIVKLNTVIDSLTDDDMIDILISTANNNQISWLLSDEDVHDFILPILDKYGGNLSTEQYNIIASGLGIEEKKVTPSSPDIGFDDIDGDVESWIELQSDIARGR